MRVLVAVARPLGFEGNEGWEPVPDIAFSAVQGMMDALGRVPRDYTVRLLTAATLPRLDHELRCGEYDALHLIAHGSPDGNILLEQELTGTHHIGGKLLFDALSDTGVKLLTLSSCHGQAAIDGQIPDGLAVAAVNAKYPTPVGAAHLFFEALYGFLLQGKPIAEAFAEADKRPRLDLLYENIPRDLFLLLADNGYSFYADKGEPNLAPTEQEGTWYEDPSFLEMGTFIGRSKERFEVLQSLSPVPLGTTIQRAPVLVLHGPGGMGKTYLARAVCRRAQQDRRFPGGIYLIAAEAVTSGPALTAAVLRALDVEAKEVPLPQLIQFVAHTTQGMPALFYLDNMEQMFSLMEEEDGVRAAGEAFAVIQALCKAHDEVKVLCTSQAELAVRDESKVAHYSLKGFYLDDTFEYLAEKAGIALVRNSKENVESLKKSFRFLHEATGGHPLSLFLLMARYPDLCEEEGDSLKALRLLVDGLRTDCRQALALDEALDLPTQHLSIAKCLERTLGFVSPEVRSLFLHLCLFPAGLTWRPQKFLSMFVGLRDKARKRLQGMSLMDIALDKDGRQFLAIQPALRTVGRDLLLEAEPDALKFLGDAYRNWLNSIAEGHQAGGLLNPEQCNIAGLCHELAMNDKLGEAMRLYGSLMRHYYCLRVSHELADFTADMVNTLRVVTVEKNKDALTYELATTLNNWGGMLVALGRREDALSAFEEAVAILRKLSELNPARFLPELARSLNNLGGARSYLGYREEALTTAKEAAAILRKLSESNPAEHLPELAISLNNLGGALSAFGCQEEALTTAEEAVEYFRKLAVSSPASFLPDLAMSLNNLGKALSDMGRREETLASVEEATKHYRTLVESNPDVFLSDLAASLNNLGNSLSDLGRSEEALTAAKEAIKYYRILAESNPDAFLPDLAMSLNNQASYGFGPREEVLAAAEESVAIRRTLAVLNPMAFLPDLAGSLNNLGNILYALSRVNEAQAALFEAFKMLLPFYEKYPDAFGRTHSIIYRNLQAKFPDIDLATLKKGGENEAEGDTKS